MTLEGQIIQLETQQKLLTDAVRAMLEGNWCGAPPSTDAFVRALDPGLDFVCVAPLLASDVPPPPAHPGYDPNTPMPGQVYDWTCSACSTEWVERAAGFARGGDIYGNREAVVGAIGYAHNINQTYGLMDGSGAQLRRVIKEQTGYDSDQGWLDFDTAYAIYERTFGCMSGGSWYHWVAVRGVDGHGNLFIANSAPGYKSVWDILSREDFNRLGPFSCVWVTG